MIDRTPTTAQVRYAFAGHNFDGANGASFDRWLASVQAHAWVEGMRDGHAMYCPSDDARQPCPTNCVIGNPYDSEERS